MPAQRRTFLQFEEPYASYVSCIGEDLREFIDSTLNTRNQT